MNDDFDNQPFHELLQQRLAELDQLLNTCESRRQSMELDQAKVGRLSRMDAMQQQAMLDAVRLRNLEQRLNIQRALSRIKSGDFGWCEICDERISSARLRIDPANPLCIVCAGGKEQV